MLWLIWLASMFVLVAGVVLQAALMDFGAYAGLVAGMYRAGRVILIGSGVFFVADLVALSAYTLSRGADAGPREVVTDDRPLGTTPGRTLFGSSKLRMLHRKSGYVTVESVVDGSATFGERMMLLGILSALLAFALIWVGMGLMLAQRLLVCVLLPIPAGAVAYSNLRIAWRQYRSAKERLARRAHRHDA